MGERSMNNLKIIPKATEIPNTDELKVGDWYWVEPLEGEEDTDPWLGCIVHLGSNYAMLEGVYVHERIHFDNFAERCIKEDCPDRVIYDEIKGEKAALHRLMSEIHEVTAKLGMGTEAPSSDTQALATTDGRRLGTYKKALVKAKDDELPKLFEKVKNVHYRLAKWMKAEAIPLKAQTEGMKDALVKVNERIHSVELYAGLTEDVVQVSKGNAAPRDAKLHLMQRMHFMDEECLVNYEAGGMTFEDIKHFDWWLKKKVNRDRLLPFPRCCIAFRVRRNDKPDMIQSFQEFIRMVFAWNEPNYNRLTFLYIRNGSQLYRLETSINFGETLFPDTDRSVFGAEELMTSAGGFGDLRVVSRREYEAMQQAREEKLTEWKADLKVKRSEHRKEMAAWKKLSKRAQEKTEKPYLYERSEPWDHDHLDSFEAFDPSNLYYDDTSQKLAKDIKQYNKIGLLLQGLFDRSTVLHPHPKAKLWTAEGFDEAIKLIYDKDRALVSGPQPNFEAYREKLNASLKTGSVTIGQYDAWRRDMAETHPKARDYATHYTPPGNHGPGLLAKISKWGKRSKKATFRWFKERSWRGEDAWRDKHGWDAVDPGVGTSWACEAKLLLNVDAYIPGDYKQFFEDPRTRAQYLRWAPLLLAAEDYHAGKRKVDDD